tara:strand:- start:1199 stop:2173 length:975 start_codon:yes stop_codon:yes gene_type:complete
MIKKALITGITGQDGSYLAEHLLELNYKVYGLIRRNSITEHQQSRLEHLNDHIDNRYGDVLDPSTLNKTLSEIQPDEVYNLAAQSHVRISYEIPQFTVQTNALGALNVFESVRINSPVSKIYQASSSEMFGDSVDPDNKQRETTKMNPVSPYGCAKVFAYNQLRNYRHAYKMFGSNGILFNHESPRRASNFVTAKVIKNAIQIKKGIKKDKLEMGNLDSKRDWGHSKDYVRAMHLILQHKEPDDFVVSTGETRSIRDLCRIVFEMLGMNYEDYVTINPKYFRPQELPYLCGDCTKIKEVIKWEPKYTFEALIEEMLDYFYEIMK